MLAFVVALNIEAEKVIEQIENKKTLLIAGKKIVEGNLFGKEVALTVCGVGKVNAALAAQALIDRYSPEYVINFGTAGGADESVEIFSYYLIEKACQYDFDVTDIDSVPVGYMEYYDRIFFDGHVNGIGGFEIKNLATADRFSNKVNDINTVKALKCNLRDMEGGAIAETCTANDVPLVMVKGVTDTYTHPAKEFYANLVKVCSGFPEVVKTILEQLK